MKNDNVTLNRDSNINDVISLRRTGFFSLKGVKKVLICFHGFQTSLKHDLQDFKTYFDEVNQNKFNEVCLASLYTLGDKKTYSHKKMYEKARTIVKDYIDRGYLVYILAYSFSSGLCAKICNEFSEVSKLVLVSPTTYLLKTRLLINYIIIAIKHIKFRLKYGNKGKALLKKNKSNGVIKLSIAISVSIVHFRKFLKKVRCRIFMIKGNKDEFSITNTFSYISMKAERAITQSKIYPSLDHTMIINKETGIDAYNDILKFVFHMNLSNEGIEDD